MVNLADLIIGVLLGGVMSWIITHWYYRRQNAEVARTERKLFNRFDELGHYLKSNGIDIRTVLEAIKAKDTQALDAAITDLVKLQQKVDDLELLHWLHR